MRQILMDPAQLDRLEVTPDDREHDDPVRRAVDGLPEPDRSLVEWLFFEQVPFAEVGRRLGMGRTRLRRVRERALESLANVLLDA